ncbi:MAG: hypothetical protein ACRC9X_05595, partial [Bacteroidales bacterium]
DTLYIRVNPYYVLNAKKTVDSIKWHKGKRAPTPSLDSTDLYQADTVFYKIVVKNEGRNDFTEPISIQDTFPRAIWSENRMVMHDTSFKNIGFANASHNASYLENADRDKYLGYHWANKRSSGSTPIDLTPLKYGDSIVITYGLAIPSKALVPADELFAKDSNVVWVNTTMNKNTAYPLEGDTVFAIINKVHHNIYEFIDFDLIKEVTPHTDIRLDSLVCDSIYQEFDCLLKVINLGSSISDSIVVHDTIPAHINVLNHKVQLKKKGAVSAANYPDSVYKTTISETDTIHTWIIKKMEANISQYDTLIITLNARIDSVGKFENRASAFPHIDTKKKDVDTTDNRDTAIVAFLPKVKLAIKKTSYNYKDATIGMLNSNFVQADTLLYRIEATNNSDEDNNPYLLDLVIRDTLPKEVRFIEFIQGDSVEFVKHPGAPEDSSLVWIIPRLNKGETKTLDVLVFAYEQKNNIPNSAFGRLPKFYGDSIVDSNKCIINIAAGLDLKLEAHLDSAKTSKMLLDGTFWQGDTVSVQFVLSIDDKGAPSTQESLVTIATLPHTLTGDTLIYIGKEDTTKLGARLITNDGLSFNILYNKDTLLNIQTPDTITLHYLIGKEVKDTFIITGYIAGISPDHPTNDSLNDTTRLRLTPKYNPVNVEVKKIPRHNPVYLTRKSNNTGDVLTSAKLEYDITLTPREKDITITLSDTLPARTIPDSWLTNPLYKTLEEIKDTDGKVIGYCLKWDKINLKGGVPTIINVSFEVDTLGRYTNKAHALSDSLEASPFDNYIVADSIDVLSQVDLQADLSVKVNRTLKPQPIIDTLEGDLLIYTLKISHAGNKSKDTARNVHVLFDTLPEHLVFLSAKHEELNTNLTLNGDRVIVYNIAHIDTTLKKDTATITVKVRVDSLVAPKDGSTKTNINWKAYLNCSQDIKFDNDTAKYSVGITRNEIDLELTANPSYSTLRKITANQDSFIATGKIDLLVKDLRKKNEVKDTLVSIIVPKGVWCINCRDLDKNFTTNGATGDTTYLIKMDKQQASITIDSFRVLQRLANYTIKAFVKSSHLDANPINDTLRFKLKVIDAVDLSVDSVFLFKGKSKNYVTNVAHTTIFTQGDTITAKVYLSNLDGVEDAKDVEVKIGNMVGFTAIPKESVRVIKEIPIGLKRDLYLQVIVDTLLDTSTMPLQIIATNNSKDVDIDKHYPADTLWIDAISVSKGADVLIWLDTIYHEKPYYSRLNYTVGIANIGQYRTQGLRYNHTVPSQFVVDSIITKQKFGNEEEISKNRTNSGEYNLTTRQLTLLGDTLQARKIEYGAKNDTLQDSLRVIVYVNTLLTPDIPYSTNVVAAARPIINDKNEINNYLVSAKKITVERNPYNVKFTKTAEKKRYDKTAENIIYSLIVENIGDSTAYKITIKDSIPLPMKLQEKAFNDTAYLLIASNIKHKGVVTFSKPVIATHDTVISWNIDTLAVNDTCILQYAVRVKDRAGEFLNTAHFDIQTKPFEEEIGELKDYHFDTQDSILEAKDTIKVYSVQEVKLDISTTIASKIDAGIKDTSECTQGDTIMFVINAKSKGKPENEHYYDAVIQIDSLIDSRYFEILQIDKPLHTELLSTDSLVWKIDTVSNKAKELRLLVLVKDTLPSKSNSPSEAFTQFNTASLDTFYVKQTQFEDKLNITYNPLDVAIKKELMPTGHLQEDEVNQNDVFGYYLTISNLRETPLSKIRLVDTLPKSVTCVKTIPAYTKKEVLPNQDTLLIWEDIIKAFNRKELNGGERLRVVIESCTALPKSHINTATIYTGLKESNPKNNVDNLPVRVVGNANIKYSISASTDTATEGQEFNFVMRIENLGHNTLYDFKIQDTIPSNFAILQASEGAFANNIFKWTLKDSSIASGGEYELVLTIKVLNALPSPVVLKSHLTYETGELEIDTIVLFLKPASYDVQLTKTVDKALFYTDDKDSTFTYKITLTNTRDSALHNLVV